LDGHVRPYRTPWIEPLPAESGRATINIIDVEDDRKMTDTEKMLVG
jgi:hypothetical protein